MVQPWPKSGSGSVSRTEATLNHGDLKYANLGLIADFRELSADRFDERALQLALVGALLQLGWRRALGAVQAPDEAERVATRFELRWWYQRAQAALDHW